MKNIRGQDIYKDCFFLFQNSFSANHSSWPLFHRMEGKQKENERNITAFFFFYNCTCTRNAIKCFVSFFHPQAGFFQRLSYYFHFLFAFHVIVEAVHFQLAMQVNSLCADTANDLKGGKVEAKKAVQTKANKNWIE